MTTTVFITGDRSQAPIPAAQIVQLVLAQILTEQTEKNEPVQFMTGNASSGIERAVRYMLPEGYVQVVSYSITDDNHVDFDETYSVIADSVDKAIVIHTDPLNSRLAKAVMKNFKDVEFPLDSVVNSAPDDISALMDEEGNSEEKTEE